ncbi:MAG: universal stress protein [Candidatus Nitrosopolaris sp.]
MEENVDPQKIVIVKKILMPIDTSEYKNKISSYAISIAKAWTAEITAIHVIDVWHGLWAGHEAENIQQIEQQAEDFLKEIDHMATKEAVSIKTEVIKVESIEIGKSIIDYAKENNMDVIVIGTQGMTTAIKEFFLGSVANYVIHHAHCSVFAIR